MILLIICLNIVSSTAEIKRRVHGTMQHNFDKLCCIDSGGHVCGLLNKDCCENKCQTRFLIGEYCKDDKIKKVQCEELCGNVCKKNKGEYCGSVLEDKVCCKTGKCGQKCAKQNIIELSNCRKQSLFETLLSQIGLIQGLSK